VLQPAAQALLTTDEPVNWAEPPQEMSPSALVEIETCPRRWSLSSAAYPELWGGIGYPPPLNLRALSGTVAHLALKKVIGELVRAGSRTAQDGAAVQAMRTLGGYSKVLNDCIDSATQPLTKNPRTMRSLGRAVSSLRTQVPELRARVQALLAGVSLPISGSTTAFTRIPVRPGAFPNGAHPEIELRARRIGWKGRADLVIVSDHGCEIIDFKTGSHEENHRFQMQVYALLWSRDHDINPTRRRANKLTLAYRTGAIEVAALSDAELDAFERELVERREVARQALATRSPAARPSSESCDRCGVRHLCDTYWMPETQRRLKAAYHGQDFVDIEVTITGRHGFSSWDGVVATSRHLLTGKDVVIRDSQRSLEFRVGDRIRLINAQITVNPEKETGTVVATIGVFSEAYIVSKRRIGVKPTLA
jgi:hypothetical protein